MPLQFLDDLTQPFALAPLGKQHRFQRLGIVRQGVAHAQFRAYSPPSGDASDAPDSLRRSAANNYPACVGASVSRASCTSRQSSPSSSADNCAADRRITPSSIFGQRKIPSSSLLANRHKPVPSQNTSLSRSPQLVSLYVPLSDSGQADHPIVLIINVVFRPTLDHALHRYADCLRTQRL